MDRLARTLAIRPGEGRLVAAVAGGFAALEAGRGLGEVAVDAIVLTAFDVGILPYLQIALGATGLVATLAFGAFVGGSRNGTPFVALPVVLAALIALERLAALTGARAALPVLWVSVYLCGMVLVTLLWTVAGRVFDARQAKRLFPICTSAAIGGGFAGLLLAGPAARLFGTENLVLAEAILIAAAAVSIGRLGARLALAPSAPRLTPVEALRGGAAYVAGSPLMRLVAVAYVLFAVVLFATWFPFVGAMAEAFEGDEAGLASALGLLAAAVTGTSFVLSTFVANRLYVRFGVTTIALLLPVVYVVGFGAWLVRFSLQTAVAVRFAQQVTQRGLTNAAWSSFFSVVPAARRGPVLAFMDGVPGQLGTILGGVLVLVVSGLAADAVVPQVVAVGAFAAVACLLIVVAIRRRYASSLVRTLRSGLAEQVLDGGPGLVALTRDPRVIAELCAASAAERPAERRLAAEILGRTGAPEAIAHLVRLVDDADPLVRRVAIDALAPLPASLADAAHPAIAARLDDREAEVRAAAVRTLARRGAFSTDLHPSIERDPAPGVLAELAVALAGVGGSATDRGRAITIVRGLVHDERPDARAAGLAALARTTLPTTDIDLETLARDPAPAVRAATLPLLGAHGSEDGVAPGSRALLVAALEDVDPRVRTAAGNTLAGQRDAVDALLEVLRSGSGRAQEAVLTALGSVAASAGTGRRVRDSLIAWSRDEVDRAAEYRRRAATLELAMRERPAEGADPADAGPSPIGPSSAAYLAALLRRRAVAMESRLLAALAVLGAPEATGLIRRCLSSRDPEIRAQAIEAVDALGDARLAKAVVRLLDSEPDVRVVDPSAIPGVANALLDDPDGWVRALALRTLAGYLDDARRAVVERARRDPDPAARAALADLAAPDPGGTPVPDTSATLGDIERMLLLRRVPLFEMLEPEDLQRLAATATERLYSGGEALVTEGELGDELVVIVEGGVRVVRRDASGERLLRTYEAGDHIGELAVLREGVRAATVIAEEPGVRGLVIGGQAVKAILHERPEAAMAMLATLAERISRQ